VGETSLREINISRHRVGTIPEFALFDTETGKTLVFVKSFSIYGDINGHTCVLVRYVKGKDGSYSETEEEIVKVRELRMEPEEFMDNWYGDVDAAN
jgi:hypothetical protein